MTRSVLIIDDEPDIVLMVRVALELAGYRVLEAGTGEEGLEIIEQEGPDALVLDLRLPGIDGWSVLQRLREGGSLPGERVIIVSAHGSAETGQRASQEGCAYLRKPFHPDELVRLVRAIVPA